ncbi:hypothetical protein GW17_00041692 [Ensete ventricosum]|nr:hypothetical protein GW17_00041692 [Ensete ventricosum]
MRTVLENFEIQRGRIILFSKGCSSPLLAPLCATVVTAPAQAAVLHIVGVGSRPFSRRCCPRTAPVGRAALPCTGAAPTGGRSCQWPPLQAAALAAGLPLAALQRAAATCGLATGAAYARRHRPCKRQLYPRAVALVDGCPYKGVLAMVAAPLHGVLAAAGCPLQPAWSWVAGPAWGLAVTGRPSSLLFLLRTRRTILRDLISSHVV